MAVTRSREEQLIRAAKARAIIIAFLSERPGEAFSRAEIQSGTTKTLGPLGYTAAALDNFLYTMRKSELIWRREAEDGQPIRYHADRAVGMVEGGKPRQPKVPKKHKASAQSAAVVIDIIKSTGRVRLTLGGLVIEIGVAE